MSASLTSDSGTGDSTIESFEQRIFTRHGTEFLGTHLRKRYDVVVEGCTELDLGVYRVALKDRSSWIARIFPKERTLDDVKVEAQALQLLQEQDFPAERCAEVEHVSEHIGQPVLVTELIEGAKPKGGVKTFYKLGRILGQLHSIPISMSKIRAGGAWHHISLIGGPSAEMNAAKQLLSAFERSTTPDKRPDIEKLKTALDKIDHFDNLPTALVHPDFVLANAIVPPGGGFRMIDWSGAGYGPRIATLEWSLWAAKLMDLERFHAVLAGYLDYIKPQVEEVAKFASAMAFRPIVLMIWELCTARKSLADSISAVAKIHYDAEQLASKAQSFMLQKQ